ncbi:MAG: hypothetical protein M3Z10_03540 [Gemmatimonadota bacterium]|nr:hypothetical protein [Gemmatimonadota bacterium]
MVVQPQAAARIRRHSHVRRHCSIICIALIVARFTPAITLTEPSPTGAEHVTDSAVLTAIFPLSVYLCPSQELCGTVSVTISVAPRDTVQ